MQAGPPVKLTTGKLSFPQCVLLSTVFETRDPLLVSLMMNNAQHPAAAIPPIGGPSASTFFRPHLCSSVPPEVWVSSADERKLACAIKELKTESRLTAGSPGTVLVRTDSSTRVLHKNLLLLLLFKHVSETSPLETSGIPDALLPAAFSMPGASGSFCSPYFYWRDPRTEEKEGEGRSGTAMTDPRVEALAVRMFFLSFFSQLDSVLPPRVRDGLLCHLDNAIYTNEVPGKRYRERFLGFLMLRELEPVFLRLELYGHRLRGMLRMARAGDYTGVCKASRELIREFQLPATLGFEACLDAAGTVDWKALTRVNTVPRRLKGRVTDLENAASRLVHGWQFTEADRLVCFLEKSRKAGRALSVVEFSDSRLDMTTVRLSVQRRIGPLEGCEYALFEYRADDRGFEPSYVLLVSTRLLRSANLVAECRSRAGQDCSGDRLFSLCDPLATMNLSGDPLLTSVAISCEEAMKAQKSPVSNYEDTRSPDLTGSRIFKFNSESLSAVSLSLAWTIVRERLARLEHAACRNAGSCLHSRLGPLLHSGPERMPILNLPAFLALRVSREGVLMTDLDSFEFDIPEYPQDFDYGKCLYGPWVIRDLLSRELSEATGEFFVDGGYGEGLRKLPEPCRTPEYKRADPPRSAPPVPRVNDDVPLVLGGSPQYEPTPEAIEAARPKIPPISFLPPPPPLPPLPPPPLPTPATRHVSTVTGRSGAPAPSRKPAFKRPSAYKRPVSRDPAAKFVSFSLSELDAYPVSMDI